MTKKIIGIVLAIIIVVFIGSLFNDNTELRNERNEALAEKGQWKDIAQYRTNITDGIAGKNIELKKKIKDLNAFANAAHMEAKKARFSAADWKKWGQDMEKLALTHAVKFQKIRIEHDKLTGELNLKKIKTESLKQSLTQANKDINIRKNIIERQKAEIARLQEAYGALWKKHKKKK